MIEITIKGTASDRFRLYRTSGNGENYSDIGETEVKDGKILYRAPANSATTFFAVNLINRWLLQKEQKCSQMTAYSNTESDRFFLIGKDYQ